ncbi:MAG: Hsp20/alpha crystallin family protein [Candidatus Hydrogenedentes bacterium]|nr:Hsp20/alpha crystallin family protein [Candidatus Hydrogenedentota bacterium]
MKEKTVPTKAEQPAAPDTREETRALVPPVDIFEVNSGLAVVVDLPGVDKDGVSIDVHDDILTIKGAPQGTSVGEPLHREFELAPYFRQFQLSDEVDQDKIRAEMKFGVLTINLPKVAEKQPRKISVDVAS